MDAKRTSFGKPIRACVPAFAMAVVLALACATLSCLNASEQAWAAASNDDATLTLVVKRGTGTSAKSIDGVKLSVYQVAKIGAGNHYELLGAYAKAGKSAGLANDFDVTMTADNSNKLAKAMAAVAKKRKAVAIVTTGKDGTAKAGSLDYGVYLVMQTGAAGTAKGYKELDPVLVNVPQFTSDDTVFDVTANLKPTPKPASKPTSATPKKDLPKTHDSLDWGTIALCCALGMIAMIVAIVAARRMRRA